MGAREGLDSQISVDFMGTYVQVIHGEYNPLAALFFLQEVSVNPYNTLWWNGGAEMGKLLASTGTRLVWWWWVIRTVPHQESPAGGAALGCTSSSLVKYDVNSPIDKQATRRLQEGREHPIDRGEGVLNCPEGASFPAFVFLNFNQFEQLGLCEHRNIHG